MRGAKADYPGCTRLHGETSAGRRRRCRGTVAAHRRNAGFAQRRASALASCRADNSAAHFGLTHARGRRATRDRFELLSQSAGGKFATPKHFAAADYFSVDRMINTPIHCTYRRSGYLHRVLLAFQDAFPAIPSASPMRKRVLLLLATLLPSAGLIKGEIKTPENAPIEITSTGETTYENGLATARENVAI